MSALFQSVIQALLPHLIVAPIVVPMLAAAVMILLPEERRPLKLVIGAGSSLLGLSISSALLLWVNGHGPVAYPMSNWSVPFGIALAVDRLSAAMLVLTWTLGGAALLFSSSRWHRAGVHFPALFQLLLMGLSGVFVTGDIFNLFVFFEILLAASYGLVLHGSGAPRLRASLRYVAVNVAASAIFLIGVSTIYGVTGTLNMAELAARLSGTPVANRHLVDAGAALLAVAFLIKAGAWPLNFWLVPAYAAATPPAAAVFAVLTKVGVYALVRLWILMFGGGPLARLGANGLLAFGLGSALLAALGILASSRLAVQISWAVVISASTLLAAVGLGDEAVLGAALFYLVPSTIACCTAFLLEDLVERWRAGTTIVDEAPFLNAKLEAEEENLDDEEAPLVGRPFPASTALLAFAYLGCVLLIAGLPPFPTFLGKAGMLSAALAPARFGASAGGARAAIFAAVLLTCGFLTLVALTRTGIRIFWSGGQREPPRVRAPEGIPIVALLGLCAALTVAAGPTMAIAMEAAHSLHNRQEYVDAVRGTAVRPSPTAPEGAR